MPEAGRPRAIELKLEAFRNIALLLGHTITLLQDADGFAMCAKRDVARLVGRSAAAAMLFTVDGYSGCGVTTGPAPLAYQGRGLVVSRS